MKIWKLLESIVFQEADGPKKPTGGDVAMGRFAPSKPRIPGARQKVVSSEGSGNEFRGASGLRLKDLQKLASECKGGTVNPDGGVVKCKFAFDRTVPGGWKAWYKDIKPALTNATTGDLNQYAGAPVGTHAVKTNYSGRVSFDKGKPNSNFERLPSSMDKYDVLMVSSNDVLKKFAYSPSIGNANERAERLKALLSGGMGGELKPLSRRPQGEVPEPETAINRAKRLGIAPPEEHKSTHDRFSTIHGPNDDGEANPNWKPDIDMMLARKKKDKGEE